MTTDDKFDIRDSFQDAFAKLVAEHLDKCDSPESAEDVQYILQDCANVFGCSWQRHSAKFRPLTAAEVIKSAKPKSRRSKP